MSLTDKERAKYPPVEYGAGNIVAFRDYDAEIVVLLTEIRDLLKPVEVTMTRRNGIRRRSCAGHP